MGGDFNAICRPEECEGSGDFDSQATTEFIEVVDGLIELDPVDRLFTWSNRHVRSRIDRTFVNDSWLAMWPRARPTHLHSSSSDHTTMLLEKISSERGKKPFKMYNT